MLVYAPAGRNNSLQKKAATISIAAEKSIDNY
jgi:hypothetical protein